MPRIRTVPPEEASGELAEAYEGLAFAFPVVPGVFQLSSIRPDLTAVLVGLYRALFAGGELSAAAKETIATFVSSLNQCPYCVGAHSVAMHLYGASEQQVEGARTGDPSALADHPEVGAFLPLAEKITRHAYKVTDGDIESLRAAGWSDEKILEAIHVVLAYNVFNRLADTLGLTQADFERELVRTGELLGGAGLA